MVIIHFNPPPRRQYTNNSSGIPSVCLESSNEPLQSRNERIYSAGAYSVGSMILDGFTEIIYPSELVA